MNSFQNVFSACVDKVKVRDGAGRAKYLQLLESGGKSAAEGRLQLEPASAFSDKREDPKISALRLKQTVDGAFLQSKTTYEVSLALLDQTVKWRMFMIS